MSTEIRHIDLYSVIPTVSAFGLINGVFVSLPLLWHWIETNRWITGIEMGFGMFVLGVAISIVSTAIATAVVALLLVGVYNVVANRMRGIEVTLRER